DCLPVCYSQTDWSKLLVEIGAIHSSQAIFIFHHFGQTVCTAIILKNSKRAGSGRKNCKIRDDAAGTTSVFQNNVFVDHPVAPRLRRVRDDRPVRVCCCHSNEKENGE